MAEYTNAEVLASWLVRATQVGSDGRLIPTKEETVEIIEKHPPQYEEALAMAEAFVRRVVKTEPRDIVSATQDWLREVNGISNKIGSVLSSPPAVKQLPRGGRR